MSPWRSIIDDPPAAGRVVLIHYGTGMTAVAKYEREGNATGWHLGGGKFALKPTHWMPMPLPPSAYTSDAGADRG